MSSNLKVNGRKFKKNVRKAERIVFNKLPKEALREFKRVTPVESGNAKKQTKLTVSRPGSNFSITQDTAYSGVIDKGLYGKPPGSANSLKTTGGYSNKNIRKAAPYRGLVSPTLAFIKRRLRRYFRRF